MCMCICITIRICIHTVRLNLNFTHACGYTHAHTRFMQVKVYNVGCILFVACSFVVQTCD